MIVPEKNFPKPQSRTVDKDEAGLRLDRWFRRYFPSLTHGQLQKFLRTGQIRVDGKRADAGDRLDVGQTIRLPPQVFYREEKTAAGSFGAKPMRNLDRLKEMILYEDDDVVVLNKPAGLAVQGGTGLRENLDDTLMAFSRDKKTKPKLVHRLDRDTSGVLLVARTDFAAAKLTAAFRQRETQKIYWAMTVGVPKPQQGCVDSPLFKRGERMVVAERAVTKKGAKSAVTLYQVVEAAHKKAAFVALWPITGRTHQLRVHLAHLGTPIFGDKIYGGVPPETLPLKELGAGLHLHARRLIIPHPRRGVIDIVAPLGREMQKTWQWFQFDEQAKVEFDVER